MKYGIPWDLAFHPGLWQKIKLNVDNELIHTIWQIKQNEWLKLAMSLASVRS